MGSSNVAVAKTVFPEQANMGQLSVVIPALNEEDGIAEIVERVLAVRPALAEVGVPELELIVVDDGSTDATADVVRGYPEVRLVQHPVNRGYGAALKTGFNASAGGLVGFLDADGTYPPEHFPRLCQQAHAGADVVVGSRRSGADSQMPMVRRIGNFVWSNLVTLLSNAPVIDPASGMRVFRKEAFGYLCPLPDGLNFTPVMSTRAVHEGLRMDEIPIPYEERAGRSKLNVVKDGARFLQTIIWTSLTYNPVRILGGLGLVSLLVAGIIALVLIIMRLAGVTTLNSLGVVAILIAMIASMVGVDLFALGATFNYAVSIFQRRPVRQGLFGEPLFKTPLDRQFWWMGLLMIGLGTVFGVGSLIASVGEWPIARVWLYLIAGVMLVLVGLQLILFWVIMRVLEELESREVLADRDLSATGICQEPV